MKQIKLFFLQYAVLNNTKVVFMLSMLAMGVHTHNEAVYSHDKDYSPS